jgi:hypothetical protein
MTPLELSIWSITYGRQLCSCKRTLRDVFGKKDKTVLTAIESEIFSEKGIKRKIYFSTNYPFVAKTS